MPELQDTLFGDGPVPVRVHPNDTVECSDGADCLLRDAFVDCRGEYHSDDADQHDANVTIVTEILKGIDEWATEYCTENTDYVDGYFYVVDEMSHDWAPRIEEWFSDLCYNGEGYEGYEDDDDFTAELVAAVREAIDVDSDCEPEYDANDYACYTGSGCCLWSFDIGEHEEQVEISAYPELQALHDQGILDDVLDDVNCDAYVCRSRRREKNEKTGYYEPVGRETYMPYDRHTDCPCFEVMTSPGGQWRFVIPADRMDEIVQEAIAVLNGCEE
jgi:hypothetical protein